MRNKFSYLFFISTFAFGIGVSQTGKVGINTTTPQAMLHVKDSSVLFSGASTNFFLAGNPPASGPGRRMMWYSDKAAFRVGRVVSANWDKDSIGDYSFASGYNTKASGDVSTALGNSTIASGNYSTAMGYFTVALGDRSTAMGYNTNASGTYSIATGFSTLASGNSSIAMGDFTVASGEASTALGNSTIASGKYSLAMGLATNSRPYGSLVIGRYNDSIVTSSPTSWIATDPVFIIGNGINDINRNNAFVVFKNGNTTLEGKLTRPSSGTDKNLVPICYGSVSNTGGINSGTSNFSVTKGPTGQYDIDITGESYSNSGYTTNVTVLSFSAPRMATTIASAGGILTVRIWDSAGVLQDGGFHFIVYKQ